MNTLDTPAQMDTAHNDGGYITEFKEKVSLSNALIQLGDVLNLKLLNNLQKQQIFLQILIKKFMNLHSDLAIIYVNVKARLVKQVLFKVYFKSSHFLHKKVWH
jgi:hypothetical protein